MFVCMLRQMIWWLPGKQWQWPRARSQSSSYPVLCHPSLSWHWTCSQRCASQGYCNTTAGPLMMLTYCTDWKCIICYTGVCFLDTVSYLINAAFIMQFFFCTLATKRFLAGIMDIMYIFDCDWILKPGSWDVIYSNGLVANVKYHTKHF